MNFENTLLTLLILIPFIGTLKILFMPKTYEKYLMWIAFGFSVFEFLLSLTLLCYFDSTSHLLQLVQKVSWISTFGISYFVGIDGISLWLVLLTTFLTPLVIVATTPQKHTRMYLASFLFLETAMIGTFVALDLFLFYVFWEMMLVPMYFIIGIWGGTRRIYATLKFVLFTLAGGVLMLLGIIFLVYLYHDQFGVFSASLLDMYSLQIPSEYGQLLTPQNLLFLAFTLAFIIKVPMFPFHTWLPDAHVEAPTGGSVILAGVLLKMGTYGYLRFALPLFPQAATYFTPILFTLALIGIIYGALLALAQLDLKKLVAYSSISHMGLIMLGIFALTPNGVSGGIFQMLSHGLATGALFLMVGMIYERRHTRELDQFGGLAQTMPIFSSFLVLFTLSSIAFPSTNGFVGEFLILLGVFQNNPWISALAATSVVLGAYYMLSMIQKVIFGSIRYAENKSLKDLSIKEISVLVPIVILIFWMGLYPKPFLSRMEKSVDYLITHAQNYDLGVYEKNK